MNPKKWQNMFHVTVNENSIAQHVIQIKINVNIKIIISAKETIVGILVHVPVGKASI